MISGSDELCAFINREPGCKRLTMSAFSATLYVWFLSLMQTMNRGGWMLAWVAKPTRQPDRSPPLATVTVNIG